MFQIINQPVKVKAQFENGQLKPLHFYWQNSDFKVNKIVFAHTQRLGRTVLYHFSIQSNQVIYELQFNNTSLVWRLLKLYDAPDPSC